MGKRGGVKPELSTKGAEYKKEAVFEIFKRVNRGGGGKGGKEKKGEGKKWGNSHML